MCKPKPGPRCANHTRTALIAAKNHLQEVKDSGDEQAVHLAKARFMLARREFHSTPTGQKRLRSEIITATATLQQFKDQERTDTSYEAMARTSAADMKLQMLQRELKMPWN